MAIQRVNTPKSFGVMIDEFLTWSAQADHVTTKVTSGLTILRRLRDVADHNTLWFKNY